MSVLHRWQKAAARVAMIAIVNRSSMSVKAALDEDHGRIIDRCIISQASSTRRVCPQKSEY
jgi:hypothetical protein